MIALTDLKNLDDLEQACVDVLKPVQADRDNDSWGNELHEFLEKVRIADFQMRASEEFQREIWDDNPVTKTGMGTVPVDKAIKDPEFRHWLAEQSLVRLPDTDKQRTEVLDTLFDELETRMRRYSGGRTPRLKIYRVLASFFPSDFTTVSDDYKLRKLHSAMFEERGCNGPSCHAAILRRLREAIGPAGDDLGAVVDRMRLPWLLYERYVEKSDDVRTEPPRDVPGKESLVPLSAARRRRGLTGVTGGFQAALNILEFCRDGVPREDLKSHIRTINPTLKDTSINTQINVIASELNCLKFDGGRCFLTERGKAYLESGDPAKLMDWLVTTILGVDHVLVFLRDGPHPRRDIVNRIQQVNPNWTSNRVPTTIVRELQAYDMLGSDKSAFLSLTDAGRYWANQIHWEPEKLVPETVSPNGVDKPGETPELNLPTYSEICREIAERGRFSESVIRKLHFGIWANERRHVAILTGLSGSGKTLLARAYGSVIARKADAEGHQLYTVPVQPGWYDPSALLGYVNPLHGNSYVRTRFLECLLTAADTPDRPFTVVLDEMNLSRPEQYLAPILSAMETGAALSLHREGEIFDGVPANIPYPSNLVIIGTVNMDETTHGISDKVLDRAFTIEFWDVDLTEYPRWGQRSLDAGNEGKARSLLEDLMDSLRPARLHFGWRVVDDVLDYMARVTGDDSPADPAAILDDVVYAKVLPKLRGADDSDRFGKALDQCAQVLENHGLKECRHKVLDLKADLETTGAARFWR